MEFHTMKTHFKLIALSISLLLSTLPLTACGTFEVGIEYTPTPTDTTKDEDQATRVATEEANSLSTPEFVSTPIPTVTELRVAFVNVTEHGNNAWLWTESEGEAIPLTKDGGVGDVKISDDGEIVAFARGDGLWMVKSDGTEERQLVSAEDFATLEPREGFDELEVTLDRFEWIPGTHVLAFNTRLRMDIGLMLNDDLYLVNADTLERITLLPPGAGGEFYYSPDGSQAAIVTSGSISLINADGSDRREVFTYTPVTTRSEFWFYAQPVWMADSSALWVAIPPADPFVQPSPSTSVWHIPTDGTPASMRGSIATGQMMSSVFSPDLRYVAHLHQEQSDPTAPPVLNLLVTDLDSGETIAQYSEATLVYEWSPDSQHFAFLASSSDSPSQAKVGQLGGDVVPVYSDAEVVIDLRWVDADRYLFLAQSSKGWDIMLGEIGGPVKSVAGVVGLRPAYDFAAPTMSMPLSGASPAPTPITGDSGDSFILFGLIYQNAEGLWHVNADGESAQIFDRPGAAVSPDSAQVLYEEADDIWLADAATGERRNLTQSPDRSECCAQWWPGQPDAILFNSWTSQSEGPSYGFPTMVQLDGSGYRVLDDGQASYALPAPSPDGQTVAYDQAGQAWLYRQDTGSEPFDLTPYGMTSDPQLRVVSPAWSPDRQRLAWVVGDCRQGECEYSIGVFDLEAHTAQFLHPYTPVGMGGQPPAPAWSPDGRWLAFNARAMNDDDVGLWVARADGQQEEEHNLDPSYSRADPHPVWSPDGRWLAFNSMPQGARSGIWLAKVETWDLHSPDLPPDAYLVDWISPRP
jgi:Tol biopolymer transport system component